MSIIDRIVNDSPDTNQPVSGGDYVPPPAGTARLRFRSYIEIGNQVKKFKGVEKVQPTARLGFELSGPKYPPREDEHGNKYPQMLHIDVLISRSDKGNYYKMFKRMNYEGKARHFVQLLGQDFLGDVEHRTVGEGADKKVFCNLNNVRPPMYEDPESGTVKRVTADPLMGKIQFFVWEAAPADLKEMWANIYIKADGDNADKRNVYQNAIMNAQNFESSPIHEALTGMADVNLPPPESADNLKKPVPKKKTDTKETPEDDPLAVI